MMDNTLLIGGGVAAAGLLAAGWTQIKSFLHNLTTLLVVKIDFSGPSAYATGSSSATARAAECDR